MKELKKHLVYVAYKEQEDFTQAEMIELKEKAMKRCIDDCLVFRTRGEIAMNIFAIFFFDVYFVEDLSFKQKVRHLFRRIKATIPININISSVIVKVIG